MSDCPKVLIEKRLPVDVIGAEMGEIEKLALERNALHRDWICDERRMALTKGATPSTCTASRPAAGTLGRRQVRALPSAARRLERVPPAKAGEPCVVPCRSSPSRSRTPRPERRARHPGRSVPALRTPGRAG